MKTPRCLRHQADAIRTLQRRFLTLLPRIEVHGRIHFRHVKCPIQREEVVAEMVALCCYAEFWIMQSSGTPRLVSARSRRPGSA